MANWLIFDFETMSKKSTSCPAVDLAAIVVDTDRFISDNPYSLRNVADVTKWKLSVADQVKNYGAIVEKDTVEFWAKQSPEVRAKVKPQADDLTVDAFVESFHQFLIRSPKIDYWWSRGNSFDPVIIERLFEYAGKMPHFEQYLKFWRVRDIRTYIDAKLDFPKTNGFVPVSNEELWNKVFKQHDSSWDIIGDVLRMQTIARIENDLEMTEK